MGQFRPRSSLTFRIRCIYKLVLSGHALYTYRCGAFTGRMKEQDQLVFESASGKHRCEFKNVGEIRFGPAYYEIHLDGQLIKEKIFGYGCRWHPDEKFIALQEWLTIDLHKGPITALTMIDLRTLKMARVSKVDKGWIRPLKFENDLIVFEKDFTRTTGQIVELGIDLRSVYDWG